MRTEQAMLKEPKIYRFCVLKCQWALLLSYTKNFSVQNCLTCS